MTQPFPPKPAPRAQRSPLYYDTRKVARGAVRAIRSEQTRTGVRILGIIGAGVGVTLIVWVTLVVVALWK